MPKLATTTLLLALVACRGLTSYIEDTEDDTSVLDTALDTATDTDSDTDTDTDADTDTDTDTDTDADADACEEEIAALSAEMYATLGGCTAVVRLDYLTRELLGYQLVCGSYSAVDESAARARAQSDTGYGSTGTMLNETGPADEYVFYLAPGDFGGAAAVSANTGLSVFGGSIIWMGTGSLTWPTTWRDVSTLGSDCPEVGGIELRRGWDLVLGGTAMASADVDAAVEVVLDTAIPAAMWSGGYVFDAVVLSYPRSMGMFDPKTAEWIVLVNGGWLE